MRTNIITILASNSASITVLAALIGGVVSFILSIISIMLSVIKFRKKTFWTSVTKARYRYLMQLRKLAADFCYLATASNIRVNRLRALSYELKLRMNPAGDEKWDREAVELIDTIVVKTNPDTVKSLEKLMQSWFAFEWQGMKKEAQKGNLSDIEKKTLRNKLWREYERSK